MPPAAAFDAATILCHFRHADTLLLMDTPFSLMP